MTGSTPQHRELRRVVASLAARLPGQSDGLLDDERFEAGRAALDRLRDPQHASALDALDAAEAGWLAEELQRRWAAVGDPVLDPLGWLEASDDGEHVTLAARADGLEPGWTVAWSGAAPTPDDPSVATATSPTVTARFTGRGPDGRVILTASWARPTVGDP